MALRDSSPKRSIVKPQQPAPFICTPYPSQSEVHPRDGRTQMIPVNFPGRWGCQRKAGIGRDSREKARSPTFPSVPSFVGNIYTPQWSLISCQLQRAFTLSINITSVDCKTCGFHQDFNSTQTIKEMTVWASNKYELCSCRVWPYRRVRKGDLVHTLQCFHG